MGKSTDISTDILLINKSRKIKIYTGSFGVKDLLSVILRPFLFFWELFCRVPFALFLFLDRLVHIGTKLLGGLLSLKLTQVLPKPLEDFSYERLLDEVVKKPQSKALARAVYEQVSGNNNYDEIMVRYNLQKMKFFMQKSPNQFTLFSLMNVVVLLANLSF